MADGAMRSLLAFLMSYGEQYGIKTIQVINCLQQLSLDA